MAKDETIFGGVDDETLIGQDGADVINGGYGDDRLEGGAGNDVLDGDRGSDLLIGGAGNDTLISDSDAGEPVVAQEFDANQGRNGEIDAASNRLYPNQPFVADDILVGGEGADTFLLKPQINAKADIIEKHTDDNGQINWAAVAGENNNVHDHWVDSIGTDVIADYDKAEGDRIQLFGHTVDPSITYADVDGDGDEESIIRITSNQGAGGGAHNGDLLGHVVVHGDRVEESDIELRGMQNYGVIETIDQLAEAIAPTGTPDTNIDTTQSENPLLGEVETRNAGESSGNAFVEQIYERPTIAAEDDVITGTDGDDVLVGDPMVPASASLDAPISYWSLGEPVNGAFSDATGVSDARFYLDSNGQATLQTAVPTITGRDGSPVAEFGAGASNTFAYVANDAAYQVLNGTVSAWINPTDLGGTILAKDALGPEGGGHFHMEVDAQGRLLIRVAEGKAEGGDYNHEWRSNAPLIAEGQWQNVALSFGAAGVAVYLDGQLVGDDQFQNMRGATAMSEFTEGYAIGNDAPIVIGANNYRSDLEFSGNAEDIGLNQSLQDFFEGGITDVGFWGGATPGEALSAEQIAELVANGPGDLSGASAPTPPPIPVGNDVISGEGGNDTIDGGAGDDQLDGGTDNDVVLGGYGDDTVSGGAGNDVLDGGHGEDILNGGDGDDRLVSSADSREPVIAQEFDASDDPNGEIDPDARMLYPSQANLPADDVLTGGAGADEFFFETLINAKEDIINKHVNDDRTIDWMGVAGENNNVHDHWVDGIGNDTVTDFNRAEGDTISIEGHTTEVSAIDISDVDGDGDLDTVLQLRSNQGANGGAHNLDLLGTITVLDNELTAADFTVNAAVANGIVETIDEYQDAVTPLGITESALPVPPTEPPVEEPPEVVPPIAEVPPTEVPLEPPEVAPPIAEVPPTEVPLEPPVVEPPTAEAPGILEGLLTPTEDNPQSDAPSTGDDLLIGAAVDDDMMGSWGDDRLVGAGGDDNIMGGHGDDLISGDDGDDFLAGDFGDDILVGGTGQDELRGNRGDDVLVGGDSDDSLDGGAGDDVLYGGAGEDLIDGGRGVDTVVLDGAIEDYTVTAVEDGIVVTDVAGVSDLLMDVEHVHFNGSGETFAIQDGAFVATEDTDEVVDLLEGDLLAELLNVSLPTGPEALSVDGQLAEMAELGLAQQPLTPGGGDGMGALPIAAMENAVELDLGIDVPGEDGLRVA